mgnify:CR=1 FL=1
MNTETLREIGEDKSLLLVDDDEPFLRRLAKAMEKRGFEVETAGSVAAGKAIATARPTAFAVVDLRLEDGNGLDVVEVLREKRPESRIVVLTGYGAIATAVAAVKIGATDYLSKPFNRTKLLECINHYLSRPEHDSTEKGSTVENKVDNQEPQYIDEEIIQQIIRDTDASVMPELIEFYIIESKVRVDTISKAGKEKDLYALEFEAHTLGSSALTLGNIALSAIAREIELHCIQQQFDEALEKSALLPDIATKSFLALEERNAQGFTK